VSKASTPSETAISVVPEAQEVEIHTLPPTVDPYKHAKSMMLQVKREATGEALIDGVRDQRNPSEIGTESHNENILRRLLLEPCSNSLVFFGLA
jgi:hypothetical protein